ncbi:uncharacterized protein [Palaemon carinicauda]|uniref:uncharacterized protein n=1 Tax=Palaemon carinicauda TaxID=392227 RepID=UPI0035B6859E
MTLVVGHSWGYLLGEALSVVESITVNEEGFDLAFKQLDLNFLDEDYIIDQAKLIIRKLCQQVSNWDETTSAEISKLWSKFCSSYSEGSQASFSRQTYKTDAPVKLFLFVDASKEAYGCAMYAVQGDYSALIFAKTKVSPIKEKTLSTLELLAAQLALKCLDTIFKAIY